MDAEEDSLDHLTPKKLPPSLSTSASLDAPAFRPSPNKRLSFIATPSPTANSSNSTNPSPGARSGTGHARRPSRAERYDKLVERARGMLIKSPKVGESDTRSTESGGEKEAGLEEEEWRECVESLLMVVDGMVSYFASNRFQESLLTCDDAQGRQLATHDELAAQLKIAQSNLTLAGAHSDFLEETLRRRDSLSFAGAGSKQLQRGSSDLARASTDSTNGEEVLKETKTGGFFSRGSISSRKKPSPQSLLNSMIGTSAGTTSNGDESDSSLTPPTTKSIQELQSEIRSLKSTLAALQTSHATLLSSNTALSSSSATLLTKNAELEKSKDDLMGELENLSVELFEEANKMVSDERKARSKAEGEVRDLTGEVERLERALEDLRAENGEEAFRRAEEELQLALGITIPIAVDVSKANSHSTLMDRTKSSTHSLPRLEIPETTTSTMLGGTSPLSLTPSPALLSSTELSRKPSLTPSEKAPAGRKWYSFSRGESATTSPNVETEDSPLLDAVEPAAQNGSGAERRSSRGGEQERRPSNGNAKSALMQRFDSEISESNTSSAASVRTFASENFSEEETPFPDELEMQRSWRSEGKPGNSSANARESAVEKGGELRPVDLDKENAALGLRSPLDVDSNFPSFSPSKNRSAPPSALLLSPRRAGSDPTTEEATPTSVTFPTIKSPPSPASPGPHRISSRPIPRSSSSDFPPEAAYPSVGSASGYMASSAASFYPLPPSPMDGVPLLPSVNAKAGPSTPRGSISRSALERFNNSVVSANSPPTVPLPTTAPRQSLSTNPDPASDSIPRRRGASPSPLDVSFEEESSPNSFSSSSRPSSRSNSTTASRAAAAIASLGPSSGKSPKSPNAARWKEKASVLSTSPSLPNLSGGAWPKRGASEEAVPDLPNGFDPKFGGRVSPVMAIGGRIPRGRSSSGKVDSSNTDSGTSARGAEKIPASSSSSVSSSPSSSSTFQGNSSTSTVGGGGGRERPDSSSANAASTTYRSPLRSSTASNTTPTQVRSPSNASLSQSLLTPKSSIKKPRSIPSPIFTGTAPPLTPIPKLPTSVSTVWKNKHNVPLPPGMTDSSYTGISPSPSYEAVFTALEPTRESGMVKSGSVELNPFEAGLGGAGSGSGMSFPSEKSANDLDSLMRNIVSMSESLFGDEIEEYDLDD